MNTTYQTTIARTLFYTSVFSYELFFLMDLLRPGIMSRNFSIHAVLIPMVLGAIWWLWVEERPVESKWWGRVMVLLAVVVGVVVFMQMMEG